MENQVLIAKPAKRMVFAARWGAGYVDSKLQQAEYKTVDMNFFSEDLGYDIVDRMGIVSLEVGEEWAEESPHPSHFVVRLV